ncbi:YcxB family protein [Streptomyces sp. TX20-6-3]|uniref:YcxB family protein n=1 Tax=Streptomyces sp. TX20-6-3 TaxID=3028705 RepID=UPI0029AAB127|nr:YcxB family protein [Streptomyces sp. TX20-6-3]MDX2558759.1 YcxB family protein [Streptomyces sp. TX20-6-3]
MDEATEHTARDGLALVYPPVFADVSEAVRVRLRATRWWAVLRWAARGACVLALAVAALVLFVAREPDTGTAVEMTLLGLVAVTAAELVPWATARSLFRMIRSQGEAKAVVDEDGGRWTTRDTDVTIRWAMLPRYVETPRLFVLLTARRTGTGFAYLPKSGLADPAAVDRLRTVLDRNSAPV